MQRSPFWPLLAALLVIDIALGFVYGELPLTFTLGRQLVDVVQLIAMAGTMIIVLARLAQSF